MKATSNGRVIRIALAVSLAVHLIVATLVHPPRVEAQAQEKPSPAIIVHIIPPTPRPTPPPRVVREKHQTQLQRPARRPFVDVVHVVSRHDKGKSVAFVPPAAAPGSPGPSDPGTWGPGPDAGPTGMPEPTATPKPACSAPDLAARTTFVESPSIPESAPQNSTIAKIRVDLDAEGNVLGASVYESAGLMELDQAALVAARHSRYAPEEINCKNVSGSYLFTVEFSQ